MFKSALQHRSILVAISVIMGLVSASLAVANGINLVPNPGFENGFTNWDLFESPGDWSISTGDAYQGSQCAKFTAPSPGYYDAAMRGDFFSLQGGVTYNFAAAIKDVNTCDTYDASDTIFDLGLSTASQWLCWIADPSEPPASPSWQIVTGTYTPAESVDVHMAVEVHGYATGSPAYAEIDAISITSVPEPSALILLGIGAITLLGYAWRRVRYPVS